MFEANSEMAQTPVIQPTYVAMVTKNQIQHQTHAWPLESVECVLNSMVQRCSHIIAEVVSRVGNKFQNERCFTNYFS